MPNMDVKKRTLLLGALLFLVFALAASRSASAQDNGIFRNGYEVPGACPQGRITQTVVSWRYDGIGRKSTNVTLADNIWGRSTANATPVPYPWMNFFAVFWAMPRHGYIAAEFDIAPWVPMWQYTLMTHGETIPGPATDMAISDQCGDFNPPGEWCARFGTLTGQRMGATKLPSAPIVAGCNLQPLGRYYINIRFTDPNAQDFYCGAVTCQTTVQNNHNP